MKITAVMGSPRKGDSYRITAMIEEQMRKSGEIDFEYLFLKDHAIGMCKGCFRCVRNGERYCPLQDDVPEILEKMQQSDGLIFASPVYALGITGLMKNFKDRSAYNAHRPSFWSKKAMAVVTSEGTGIQGTLGFIRTFDIWGIEFVSDVGVIVHPTLAPTAYYNAALEKKVKKAAAALYGSIAAGGTKKPSLMKTIQFNVLKYMSAAAKDGFPADYAYYADRKEYYYETRIGAPKKLLARLFTVFVSKWMRKNYVIGNKKP